MKNEFGAFLSALRKDTVEAVFTAASLLFVPGARPDRFPKAKAAGAGLTVIDLEDAVAAEDKESAREAALAHVSEAPADWGIRINAVTTLAGVRDLAAMGDAETLPEVLMVPMVETAAELDVVAGVLGDRCPDLVPLVETPRGLRHALEIVSHAKVSALMLGGADFSSELGVELAWEPLLGARHAMVLACAEAGKPAIDVPYIHLDDEEGFAAECSRAAALGFLCKAVIHPRQVPHANAAFSPTEAEIAEAREALDAYKAGGERAIRFKGKMLEAPFVKKYRAVLARAEGVLMRDGVIEVAPGRFREVQGRYFEDFEEGHIYEHRPGRTITDADNVWFTLLTMNTHPAHFDYELSKDTEFGKPLVVSPFTIALMTGMSVSDTSGKAIANLGWDEVRMTKPLFVGDTLYCESEVLEKRESKSRPEQGIVTFKTIAKNQHGDIVSHYKRTVLVWKRGYGGLDE